MQKATRIVLPLASLALSSCTVSFQGAVSSSSIHSSSFVSSSTSSSAEDASSKRASSSPGVASSFAPAGYHLTWQDEFDGETLDESKWEAQLGNGNAYGISGWGNGEKECYQKENALVSGGKLNLLAKREAASEGDARFDYTSARIRTAGKAFWTYGYFEAKMSLPTVTGMWPAFWMLPEAKYNGYGWPTNGEIDVMEAKGRLSQEISSTTHSANASLADVYHTKSTAVSSIGEDHVYAVLWEKGSLSFFVDGVSFFKVDESTYQNDYPSYTDGAPFNADFHLILNLAVGGQFDEGRLPPSDWKESAMSVDYVRVYQK
jgi:beta-glucanase (GH16 family)